MTPRRSSATPERPRWYVSVRSPYSWLALHDAVVDGLSLWRMSEPRVFFEPGAATAAALADAGVGFPYVPMSRAKHLYILRDVARLAAQRGLRPTWPVDRDPDWEVPSLALLAARAHGDDAVRALAERLTRARWQEAGDVTDRGVVAGAARACGLPADLADAVDDPRWRAAGLEELRGVESDGVFGVPFFVVGRQGYWGLDRLVAAQAAHDEARPLVRAATSTPPVAVAAAGGVDHGHAGGCG